MARQPQVSVLVALNDRPAIEGLRTLAAKFKANATAINQSLELVGKGVGAVTATIGFVVNATSEWVKLASVQEAAEKKLIAAASQRARFTREEFDALQAVNAATQQQTGIGDEAQLQLQAQLSLMGVRNNRLAEATRATIGLAEVTGQGLVEAGKQVGKVYGGNVQVLKEVGIHARSTSEAVRILTDNYEIAKQRTATLAGQAELLTANWGDFNEILGQATTRSGAAYEGLKVLNGAVIELQRFFSGAEGREAVNSFFGIILEGTSSAIDAVVGLSKAWAELQHIERTGGLFQPGREPWMDNRNKREQEMQAVLAKFRERTGRDPTEEERARAERIVEAAFPKTLIERLEDLSDRFRRAGTSGVRPPPAEDVPPKDAPRRPAMPTQDRSSEWLKQLAAEEKAARMRFALKQDLSLEEFKAEQWIWQKRMELDASGFKQRETGLAAQLNSERELWQSHNAAVSQIQTQAAEIGVAGTASMISGIAAAIGQGRGDILALGGQLLGGIIQQTGTMLIQLGTAGVLAGTLGTIIPALAGITGGALGVGAGLAAIAGGTAMVAIGSALGGSAGGASGSRPAAGGGGGGSAGRSREIPDRFSGANARTRIMGGRTSRERETGEPRGFTPSSTGGTVVNNISIPLGSGLLFGTPTELARKVDDMMTRRARLQVSRAGAR